MSENGQNDKNNWYGKNELIEMKIKTVLGFESYGIIAGNRYRDLIQGFLGRAKRNV